MQRRAIPFLGFRVNCNIVIELVIPAGRVPTSKNSDSSVACQKFVQSILELPATDEIHMEDRKKVWPELNPELIRPKQSTELHENSYI